MKLTLSATNTRATIQTTLVDHGKEGGKTLNVTIEISNEGVSITPSNDEDKWKNDFVREVWVEFYTGKFITHIFNENGDDPAESITVFEKEEK